MVAELVRNVGERHVEVSALMGAGVDPHLYKASPGDMSKLNSADMICYSGWHLEGKMTQVFTSLSRRKPVVAAAEAVHEEQVLGAKEGTPDPHLWFDVSLWREAAGGVRDALQAFDPPHAAEYQANCERYQSRLTALHEETQRRLQVIPPEQRVLVTAHDAFRYFGRAYQVEVRGIQGISTDSEAGVKQVNQLVDFLVERKIKAVFVETSVSDQNIRSLLEGCAARNHQVQIGGSLYSDAMGDSGSPEGTYEGMIRHNVTAIVKALQ